jgi:hypothetical protein
LPAFLALSGLAVARPVPAGAGTTIFGDVPVAPAIFPDYAPHRFGIKGNPNVRPQTFSFATYADPRSVITWYRAHLSRRGWHLAQQRDNYPGPGMSALVANRSGEAVTVIVQGGRGGSRVSIIKLNSAK